jgi:hypothetical protein
MFSAVETLNVTFLPSQSWLLLETQRCGHDRHGWVWQVVAQLAQDLRQTTCRRTESERLRLIRAYVKNRLVGRIR